MTRLRTLGLSLILLAGAVGLIGTSIADFNAQTTNASTFSSGTLVLSDAKTTGTTCLSTGGGSTDTNSNSAGCDNLMGATGQGPGSGATTSVVTLRNVGSIAATSFHVFTSACASTDAGAETYHGTGDLCTAVALSIHDDTNNRCYYPTQSAGACTISSASTLGTFATSYPSSGSALTLSTTALSSGIAFTITTQLNSTAGNTMQGRTATMTVTWRIVQ
jgi:hypothetical protein